MTERDATGRISDCAAFEAWLDDGRPAGDERMARAHAAECARCAAQWRVTLELDLALEAPPVTAPASLTERVMARVAAMRAAARADVATIGSPVARPRAADTAFGGPAAPALAWWVRAAADPAVALAMVLAALVLWRAPSLIPVAQAVGGWAMAAWRAAFPPTLALSLATLERWMPHGVVALALALALMPALAWGSWRLYLWAERTGLPSVPPSLTQH